MAKTHTSPSQTPIHAQSNNKQPTGSLRSHTASQTDLAKTPAAQEPEDRVCDLDRGLCGGEEEGEEGDVACDGEGPEGAEVPPVAEGEEGEGDEN
ncbi:hypothetical protein ACO22_06700 [Paracoccidioides brasiliensis]|uniref:Uncharacterized protein n=1 Tax=Paracoccidioides brasiliensis TaxID=121759 RepID=A0A1D2J6V1_PARBR|nr:hypothetical protein ACO22_06700 [Paracoccidioides brasiliensis]